jgi:hypothetical protein
MCVFCIFMYVCVFSIWMYVCVYLVYLCMCVYLVYLCMCVYLVHALTNDCGSVAQFRSVTSRIVRLKGKYILGIKSGFPFCLQRMLAIFAF